MLPGLKIHMEFVLVAYVIEGWVAGQFDHIIFASRVDYFTPQVCGTIFTIGVTGLAEVRIIKNFLGPHTGPSLREIFVGFQMGNVRFRSQTLK